MIEILIICSIVLLMCVFTSKVLYKFGVPALLIFLILGMLFGSDGIVGIHFDNYDFAQKICSLGLVFILFYGGFGTNWKMAKPVILPSIIMSTMGVVLTAGLTGVFCYYVLKISLLEGFLIGAVIASTDAASVFSILRSRKLNLKGGLASLLEIESGSNDTISYMLTIIILTLMSSNSDISIVQIAFKQIIFGLAIGFILGKFSAIILRRVNFEIIGLNSILVVAVALLSYSLSHFIGGNGYLSVYLTGIILGNSKILHKRSLVHFFDGISWLMQIMLFFTLGLLSFPKQLPKVAITGIVISLFLIFIARPVATFASLSWLKVPFKRQLLVSWVGLRGAASIVFAIFAITNGAVIESDIYHIVFFVALFSVAVQGTLVPTFAKKLDLVEADGSAVLRTFNDYQEEFSTKLVERKVLPNGPWVNKTIMDADIPEDILVVMIKRKKDIIVPKGSTVILPDDILVLSGNRIENMY